MNRIFRGADAQPMRNIKLAAAIGCNSLHRYDPEGATLEQWTAEARRYGMSYILQGTVCEAQRYEWWNDPNLIAIAHDDEPDMNRWNPTDPHPELFYSPDDVAAGRIHKNMLGWTRFEILQARYDRWKAKAPNIPVCVNFSGQSLTNVWTVPGQDFHIPYIKASDRQTLDLYVANNDPKRWSYYSTFAAARKLNLAGGNCTGGYVEVNWQKLQGRPDGRAPTVAEVLTQIWGWLYHGASELYLFPQVIGKQFETYWTISEEVTAAIKDAFSQIIVAEDVILNSVPQLSESPAWSFNPYKGILTMPTSGRAIWMKDGKQVDVQIDFTGRTAPVVTMTGFAPPVTEVVPLAQYEALRIEKEALAAQVITLTQTVNSLTDKLNLATDKLDKGRGAWNSLKDVFS